MSQHQTKNPTALPGASGVRGCATIQIIATGVRHKLTGRKLQFIQLAHAAGSRGVTALNFPTGARLSAYVHKLRALGFYIKTETEEHGGEFAGTHARYILQSGVTIADSRNSSPPVGSGVRTADLALGQRQGAVNTSGNSDHNQTALGDST